MFPSSSTRPATRLSASTAGVVSLPSHLVNVAHTCVVIPAFEASASVGYVVEEIRRELPELRRDAILVVDDGSRDDTAQAARHSGAEVLSHPRNMGKGAALRSGFSEAYKRQFQTALTVDADGQHPATSARDVLLASTDPEALVLGVRNLARDGAPWPNQVSNAISNFFLSRFAAHPLRDTQCGLRRYPLRETLELAVRAPGYAYEAEILLRAIDARIPIVERDIVVRYPREEDRVTHFDSVRDPMRIIGAVLSTVRDLRKGRT